MLETMDKFRLKKSGKGKRNPSQEGSQEDNYSPDIVTFSNSEDWRNWMRLHDDKSDTSRD
ncbi:hypothetical protein A2U01_0085355, partial [Trifolium medium]|nr:hypothetical protein [Trifolium medium]